MKIFAVFTGGTIGCSRKNGSLSPDSSNSKVLLDMYRRHDGSVEFESVQPFETLSENMSFELLEELYGCVAKRLDGGYEGIVIAHGTDTVQYTSAYLALRLGLCSTPVAVVSAGYPLDDARSNGFENLCAAVELFRSKQGRGLFTVYKNPDQSRVDIHRGYELLPHLPYSDSLYSLDGNVFGCVKDGKLVRNGGYFERLPGRAFEIKKQNVAFVRACPDMAFPQLDGVRAVLIEGYHSGTLPTGSKCFAMFCRRAAQREISVWLAGGSAGFEYESKSLFAELGINVLPKMSPIAAYYYLMARLAAEK